jgi:hypothetical protein
VQRKKTFLVVCFSILTGTLWAQTGVPVLLINKEGLGRALPLEKAVTLLHPQPVNNGLSWRIAMMESGGYDYAVPVNILPDAYARGYYIGNLGYFCKKELQIEKTTHLPLRFRVGSLQEVNRLEGKPGW